jgi:hypothetical protein
MKKNKGGRPSKLTPELTEDICKLLRSGAMIDAACLSSGITKETFFQWMKLGISETDSPHKQFSDSVKRALADAENSMVDGIRNAGQTQWQALAWLLERRFRNKWGRHLLGEETKSTTSSSPPSVKPKTLA